MKCRKLLEFGFVSCCFVSAIIGVIMGISCELRQRLDCREQWQQGGQLALAAAGILSAALAKFDDVA